MSHHVAEWSDVLTSCVGRYSEMKSKESRIHIKPSVYFIQPNKNNMARNQEKARLNQIEQMARRNAEILAQKRETIAVNALLQIIRNPTADVKDIEGNTSLALDYADAMLTKMYVAPDEEELRKEVMEKDPSVS